MDNETNQNQISMDPTKTFVTPGWLWHWQFWKNKNEVGILAWKEGVLSYITCDGRVIFSIPKDKITSVKSAYTGLYITASGKRFKIAFYSPDGSSFTGPPEQIKLSETFSGDLTAGQQVLFGGQLAGHSLGGAQGVSMVGLYNVGGIFDQGDDISKKWYEVLKNQVPVTLSKRIMKFRTYLKILGGIFLIFLIYLIISDYINKTGFFAP